MKMNSNHIAKMRDRPVPLKNVVLVVVITTVFSVSLTVMILGLPSGGRNIYLDDIPSSATYVIDSDGTNYWATRYDGKIEFYGTDASTVIQSALNALTSGRTWKEKIVLKLNQVVDLDAKISMPSYTTFAIEEGVLRRKANTDFNLIEISGKTNVDIVGGIYDGNKDSIATDRDIIRIANSEYVNAINCHFQNHGYEVIEIVGTSKHIGISNNRFINQRNCGVWSQLSGGNRPSFLRIIGNVFDYSYDTENVAIYETDHIIVTGNDFSYSNRAGLVVKNSTDFVISDNTFFENGRELTDDPVSFPSNQPAIYVHTNCEGGTIVGNAIGKCHIGLYIADSKKISVETNEVNLCYGDGMYISNTDGVLIRGNQICDNSQKQHNYYSGITLVKGTDGNKGLLIQGNLIANILAGAKQQRFGINEAASGAFAENCLVSDNVIIKGGAMGTYYLRADADAIFRNNIGINPKGKQAIPFDNTNNQISALASGLSSNVTSGKTYTIKHCDVFIKSAGGNVTDITIKDSSNNTMESGLTELAVPRFLPVGWKIRWTFTSAPTVTVSGV